MYIWLYSVRQLTTDSTKGVIISALLKPKLITETKLWLNKNISNGQLQVELNYTHF